MGREPLPVKVVFRIVGGPEDGCMFPTSRENLDAPEAMLVIDGRGCHYDVDGRMLRFRRELTPREIGVIAREAGCPMCKAEVEPFPDGTLASCPDCGRSGCERCIPGGRGCRCVKCDPVALSFFDGEL